MIAFLVIIILIACSEDYHEQHTTDSIGVFGTVRYYDVQHFSLDIDVDLSQFYLFLHQEQLHLFLLDEDEDTLNSYIHLLNMDADGTNVREIYRTMLDESIDFFSILGFEKHDDGYISLVTTDTVILPPYTREDFVVGTWDVDVGYTYVYRRISPNGAIVTEFGINALNNDERQIIISEVAFDLEGRAVASVTWLPADFELPPGQSLIPEGIIGRSFFLFNNGLAGDFHEVENLTSSIGLFNRTINGQVIVPSYVWSPMTDIVMFYEIDFENIAIIDGSVIEAENLIDSTGGVFPAPQASTFDFYLIGNDRELIGYRKYDGNFTPLFDFLELGVPLDYGMLDRNSILLWDDGRITVVNLTWNVSLSRNEATLFLLTPRFEPLSSTATEREIVTLGGIDINMSPLIDQVTAFNRQSDTHQIEVINYTYYDMDRLRTELVTGRGLDMFKFSWQGIGLVTALSEGDFLLDLYQMIDADPVLAREDFFPSVLSTWENSRGELVQIAPNFSIQTIIGMQSVFPEAPENWNYADFITFYKESRAAGYDYPLGQTIDRFSILAKLLFADDTFFCEQTAVANFDSESFINVLNFVITIPADQGWDRASHLMLEGQWDPVGDLLRGEQLLLPFARISALMHFRYLQTRLGGITAFGFPSNDAPTHAVQVESGTAIGIRSSSPNIEAAWEFVRLGLLPDTSHDGFLFPLRIDLFEQLVYDAQSQTETGSATLYGVTVELPIMTEMDATLLRELVSNIEHTLIIEHPVQHIVNEDIQAFFSGARSAEDTARIIQSRVQILLAERAR